MTILCIDGYNFMHRARSGFQLGDYNIVFNFVRNLRALVELHKPTRVYFVLEGCPKARFEVLPSYKANRVVEQVEDPVAHAAVTGDLVGALRAHEKYKSLTDFHRQKELIVALLVLHFPVTVLRHPDFECDDVIYNLIARSSRAVEWIVASNDSDFTQLLNEFPNVKVYNPIAKAYVATPDHDYVTWKALRGDVSDNIPGIPGIGDKTADALVNDPDALTELFKDEAKAERFKLNYGLIKFQEWTEEEAMQMTSSAPTQDWDAVAAAFDAWAFKSILKEGTWTKFKATFDTLWG